MDFFRFAEHHGLIIDNLVSDRWVRVPTIDHPGKRNGAYIFNGSNGAVQNWALHEKPITWRDKNYKHDPQLQIRVKKSQDDQVVRQDKAAKKAGWILNNAVKSTHPYLTKKGFPDEKGYVWEDLLVIPMRVDGSLVGCQLIDANGIKKFLYGQRTKGASACFDNKGSIILCEGYATALSIRKVLKKSMTRYCIHVCFSAGNLVEVAKSYPNCVIVADNDPVGIRSAKKTGRPYWVSPNQGEDFNDYDLRVNPKTAKDLLNLIGGRTDKDTLTD